MLQPIESLAFSIHSNPGVYAILLGSGISRTAKIPTGWDVTLDLIRKLAAIQNDVVATDLETWYYEKYNKDPDYADLLEQIVRTPAERQSLLRGYFERTEQDREEGVKQPTKAHRAIAKLCANGYIRVIITTNFDRLMEEALQDEGVVPTVISNVDHIAGATPFVHSNCTLIKLHGDYLDSRIRNTTIELAKYPTNLCRLLDRIFNDFGLVVCGWSARYDAALRTALTRSAARRYSLYWSTLDDLGDEAAQIVSLKSACVVHSLDADTFFGRLEEYVCSLKESNRPDPLSTTIAVSSIKRYLSDSKYDIQMEDLVQTITSELCSNIKIAIAAQTDSINSKSVTDNAKQFAEISEVMLSIASYAGAWRREKHLTLWGRAIEAVYAHARPDGYAIWIANSKIPAILLFYSLGMAALDRSHLDLIKHIFDVKGASPYDNKKSFIQLLPPFLAADHADFRILEGMERRHVPLNDWIHQRLKQVLTPIVGGDARYIRCFDTFEILIALNYLHTTDGSWLPLGAFGYRERIRSEIIGAIEADIQERNGTSLYVNSRLFGSTPDACLLTIKRFRDFMSKIRWG